MFLIATRALYTILANVLNNLLAACIQELAISCSINVIISPAA